MLGVLRVLLMRILLARVLLLKILRASAALGLIIAPLGGLTLALRVLAELSLSLALLGVLHGLVRILVVIGLSRASCFRAHLRHVTSLGRGGGLLLNLLRARLSIHC